MSIRKDKFVVINDDVKIGSLCKIWYFTQITGDVSIGANTTIGSNCTVIGIGLPVKIGDNVSIQSNVFIPGGTVIGNDVFIGPGVTILNDKYPPSKSPKEWSGVIIEDKAIVGGGCTLLPGVTIGKGAKIAAGSVVTKNVKSHRCVAGNPARYIKPICWNLKLSNEIESLK